MQLFNWLYRFRRDHAQDGVREFQEMQEALSVTRQRKPPSPAEEPLQETEAPAANSP